MILYLIRHGESAFNALGRIQGQQDPPLSELGLRQARAIGAALAKLSIEAIVASPLRRAYDTAQGAAQALGLPIQTLDDLKELNAGVFQGKTWEEVRAEHPIAAEQWLSGNPDFRIPGGESRRELMARGLGALRQVRERPEKHVAVVAHGGLLSAALKALLEIPAQVNPFSFYNASISRLAWGPPLKLQTLNEIEHLRRPDGGYDTRSGDL